MLVIIMNITARISGAVQAFRYFQWRRYQERRAAAQLHALSDYSLRDLGIMRSQIDDRVRFPARRYVRPHRSSGLI